MPAVLLQYAYMQAFRGERGSAPVVVNFAFRLRADAHTRERVLADTLTTMRSRTNTETRHRVNTEAGTR